MISGIEIEIVVGGSGGAAVVATEVPSARDCVKLEPDAVLVRLLNGALSLNVILPLGVPVAGAVYEIVNVHSVLGARVSMIEVAPSEQTTCVIEKEFEVSWAIDAAEIFNGCRPTFASVSDCVTVWPGATPTKPRLPAE